MVDTQDSSKAPTDTARPSLASRRISYDSNVPKKAPLTSTLSLGQLPPVPSGVVAHQQHQGLPAGQRSVPARELPNAFAQTVVEDVVLTPGSSPVNVNSTWASPEKQAAASKLWVDPDSVSPKKNGQVRPSVGLHFPYAH
jgi:hypothetical protein